MLRNNRAEIASFSTRIAPDLRRKIYLILVFISLTFLFYSSWQVRPVIVEPYDPIGLVSHLTLCYWIGLALLVAGSVSAFLDRELKKDSIFILLLLTLGLFLMVITFLVYENAAEPEILYPFGEVKSLLVTHHLDIYNAPLVTYHFWPTLHFVSASILEITGIGLGFVKYGPLLFMLCFVFTPYGIGKRLELAPNYCFLLSFLSLSSWLFICEYTARALAIILFLLLFMLLLTPRRAVAQSMAALLIFGALVLTHGLTALAVIPGLLGLALYRKEWRLLAAFAAIFLVWYISPVIMPSQPPTATEPSQPPAVTVPSQPPAVVESIIQTFATPARDIHHYSNLGMYQVPSSPARAVSHYSMLTYAALYASLTIGSLILLFKRKVTEKRRKQLISLFCWSVPIFLLIFTGYGQIMIRVYTFLILPVVCITVLSFSRWRLLMVALMVLCATLCLPANYAGQVSGEQVLTTEVKGAEFFALKVKPQDSYYYGYSRAIPLYYDPALLAVPMRSLTGAIPDEIDFSIMDDLHYVIISKQGTDFKLFAWREDPCASWPETEVGQRADSIYNNGCFQIYINRLAE